MSNYETNPVGALQVKLFMMVVVVMIMIMKILVKIFLVAIILIISKFQERFQSRGITPQYRVVQAEGASHAPTFSFQVTVIKIILAIISR